MPLILPTPHEYESLPQRQRRKVAKTLGLLASDYRQRDPRSFKVTDRPDLYRILYRERYGVDPEVGA